MRPRRYCLRSARRSLLSAVATALLAIGAGSVLLANPQGLNVQSGNVTVSGGGNNLTITASQNAVLNWQSFNIQSGETTTFQQPSASSVVWNRIKDANPSEIFGNLNANGVVVLMNPKGFYFGPNSMVNAAGLVVSTANATPLPFGSGPMWQFNGPAPEASIINYGQINVGPKGSAFLIAEHIENHGEINAQGGSIGLMAGKEVLLSERPDGRGLSAQVTLPTGSVDNTGRLNASAGVIAMNAQVVNQNGQLQADSVRNNNGVIELFASDTVNLGSDSRISAKGDDSGLSNGGQITIKSQGKFFDTASSQISVAGGANGGNGGQVEISASEMGSIQSHIDGHASAGNTGGKLVIDPTDITIVGGNAPSGTLPSGTVGANDSPTTLKLNVNSAFVGFSQIDLQATHNIQLADNTTWNLGQSTGIFEPGSHLTFEAGNDIIIGNGASIVAGTGWSVTLQAGRDFATPNGFKSQTGSILFQGTGSLGATDGNISLVASKDVVVDGGFVRTVGGGSINVTALSGDINTGTRANGFDFSSFGTGYSVNPDLGGISTANGGNVNLTAGHDVISYLPLPGGIQTDAGSGAFGSAAGNVTVTAGHDVVGHYVVRNGVGTIIAGNDAGTKLKQLALSLISGGWSVTAEHDILLQEVRNPNGVFNNKGFSTSPTRHRFDYSADAWVTLNGGNSVQLLGGVLPRYDETFEQGITPIYAPRLEITAGKGGVFLGNDVTLFPSPLGELRITTTDGGSLVGQTPGGLANLIMSDSDKIRYRAVGDFGVSDHAAIPVQLNNPNPVELNIAGDINGVLLAAPKRTEITVGGDMINCRFNGQNLHDGDVTSIHVSGSIINRNEFTQTTVVTAPRFSAFNNLYPPLDVLNANLPNLFSYNPATKTLTFQGRMTGAQLQALLNLQQQVFNHGEPKFDKHGNPVTKHVEFVSPEVILELFTKSQDVPSNPSTGYYLGGGGRFDITAQNMDLGATDGIVSVGPRNNHALANYFTRGADININLSGNLDMFSTRIASLNGGAVSIFAGGDINVGSKDFTGNSRFARGIYTVDPSDVTVVAYRDINVNGSRIAAYDGGDITVLSLEGNVNAGNGGLGFVSVEKIVVDPITHQISSFTPTIAGSGILATTFPASGSPGFPASRNTVGDILVETPHGDIVTGAGGIVQVPLNGKNQRVGTVTLNAGSTDNDGKVVSVGNIDARGSGVIGNNVKLNATGDVLGSIFGRNDVVITAQDDVDVNAISGGDLTVSGEKVEGTLIGIKEIDVTGDIIAADLKSQHISADGNVTSTDVGFAQGVAANATSDSLQKDELKKEMVATEKQDEENKKLAQTTGITAPKLTRAVNRVTVLTPKNQN